MEANEIHRCCHGQQQQHQHQQQQAVDPETDPSAAVEAAETNEVTLQLGKRPIVFDKVNASHSRSCWLISFVRFPTVRQLAPRQKAEHSTPSKRENRWSLMVRVWFLFINAGLAL